MEKMRDAVKILQRHELIDEALSSLASMVVRQVPTTFCRILLTAGKDRLKVRASEPIRPVDWNPALGKEYLLPDVNIFRAVIEERSPRILVRGEAEEEAFLQATEDFKVSLGAVALFPIIVNDQIFGLLLLGEQRSPPRVPYDQEIQSFCALIARTIALELEYREVGRQFTELGNLVEKNFQKANIFLLRLDSSCRLIYFSPGVERLLDVQKQELEGQRSLLDFIHQQDREWVEASLKEFLAHDKDDLELEFSISPVTKKAPRRVQAFFSRFQTGEHVVLNGLLLDLTEQIKQRQALEASQDFLASVVDQSPQGILVLDRMGSAIRLNQALVQIFQLEKESQILGKYNIFRDEVLSGHGLTARIRGVFELGENFDQEVEYDFSALRHVLLPQSEKKWLRIKLFPIKGPRAKPNFIVCLFEDITQEKRREAEKERGRRELSFLSNTAQTISRVSTLENSPPLLRKVIEEAISLFYLESGSLVFFDERGEPILFETLFLPPPLAAEGKGKRLIRLLFNPIEEARDSVSLKGDDPLLAKLAGYGIRSYLGFPLLQSGRLLGMLALFSTQERVWKEEEERLGATLAQNLAVISERLNLDQIVRSRLEDLEFIYRSFLDFVSGLDLQMALDQAVAALHKLLNAHSVIVYRIQGEELVPLAWRYRPDYYNLPEEELIKRLKKQVGTGITGLVAKTGESVLLGDAERDPRAQHIEGTPMIDESFMAVPLKVKGKVEGVITLAKVGLNQFGERELHLLDTFAAGVGVALENSQLYEKAEASRVQLSALYQDLENREKLMESLIEAFRQITQNFDMDTLLEEILKLAVKVIPNAESGTIVVKEGEGFQYRGAVGYDLARLQEIKLPPNVISRKFEVNQAVLTFQEELATEALSQVIREHLERYGRHTEIKVVLSAPIFLRGELYGYFNLENSKRADAFDKAAQDALWLFAQQATVALENALLFGEQERSLRQLENDVEEIRQLSKAKEDFLYTVSHELKTPLMVSLATTELLEKVGYKPEKLPEYGEILRRHLGRLLSLIDNLLVASKGDVLPNLSLLPTDLIQILQEEVKAARDYVGQKNLTIVENYPSTSLHLLLDQEYMRLAISNVLINAIKFSRHQGSIEVGLTVEEGAATISIKDQGIGIPAADLPYIFERFYRSPHATKAAVAGTGLGLHTAKLIVEAHGGTISMESELERGTTVSIRLPSK